MGVLTGEGLFSWVMKSCVAQGVPLKVTDGRSIDKVRTLLSGKPGRGASSGGATGERSKAPKGSDPLGVKRRRPRGARANDGMIENGLDDGNLTAEVETGPLAPESITMSDDGS